MTRRRFAIGVIATLAFTVVFTVFGRNTPDAKLQRFLTGTWTEETYRFKLNGDGTISEPGRPHRWWIRQGMFCRTCGQGSFFEGRWTVRILDEDHVEVDPMKGKIRARILLGPLGHIDLPFLGRTWTELNSPRVWTRTP